MSEVVPSRLRGPFLALFPALTLLGQLVAAGVVLSQIHVSGETSYRTAIATEWPFSAVPLVLALVLPESPAWLLQKDRHAAAYTAFQQLHGKQHASVHQDLFDDINKAVTEERITAQGRKATYVECFRGTNLRRTFIVVFANVVPELFGLPLLGHVSYFLQIIGMEHDTSFILLIAGVVLGLLANIGSFWTLLRFGRRLLILITLAIVTVLWGSIGVAGCFTGSAVTWYSAAGMMAVIVTAGIGAWPASYVVSSETSSLRLRSKTQGIGGLLGGVIRCAFGIGFPYLYNPDAADLGAKTAFIICGTSALAVAITWFAVPELKGKSAVQIDRVFEKWLGPRRSLTSDWQSDDSEDNVALRHVPSGSDISTRSDSVQPVSSPPNEPAELLRKRTTF